VPTVHCARSLDELAGERDQLDAINRESRLPDLFSTFEFYQVYFQHDEFYRHGVETELWFLTVRDEGRIIGYLPLRRVRERVLGLPSTRVEFFATHDNDRPHLVSRPADEERCRDAVLGWLREHRREWSFLELKQQPAQSILCQAEAFSGRRYCLRRFPNLDNGTIHVRWSTLREWHKSLSHKMRNNIGRQFRLLNSLGHLEHLASSDPAATPLLFELFLGIEPRSWKAGAGATLARSPRRLEFFRRLFDPRTPWRMRVDLVLLDGIPIAGIIGAAFEKRFYAIHIAFDDAYGKASPGGAALTLALRHAIESGHLCFNMLSGFSYYKTRWQAEVTPTHSFQVCKVGSARFLRAMLGELRRAIFPRPPESADYNPARRESSAAATQVSEEERGRIAAAVAELARLGVVAEGPQALAGSMPFGVQREQPDRKELAATP
jgi:CelD/BcsL family acetyltransferase involved in cellulose biosynthesis